MSRLGVHAGLRWLAAAARDWRTASVMQAITIHPSNGTIN